MVDILSQLFGQQQPQDQGGLVQSILSQRFQPTPEDAAQSAYQTAYGAAPVTAYAAQQQRMKAPMDAATQLSNMNLQGQQGEALDLQNQMLQARLQYMQGRLGNGNNPPVGFQQGQSQPQQDGSAPPVGFNSNNKYPSDPRYNQAINDAWMLDPTQVPKIEQSQIENDANNAANKTEATKSTENLVDAQKAFNAAYSNLPRALERFDELRQAAPLASSGGFGTSEDKDNPGWKIRLAQSFDPATATANNTISQISAQGILPEVGPVIQATGGRGNQFMERMASTASGIKLADPTETKLSAVNNVETQYIANLKALAAERRSLGDKNVPTDAQIDAAIKQYKAKGGKINNTTQAAGVSQNPQAGSSQQVHWNDIQ